MDATSWAAHPGSGFYLSLKACAFVMAWDGGPGAQMKRPSDWEGLAACVAPRWGHCTDAGQTLKRKMTSEAPFLLGLSAVLVIP